MGTRLVFFCLCIIIPFASTTWAQSGRSVALGNATTAYTYDSGFSSNSANQDSYFKHTLSLQSTQKFGLSELRGASLSYSQRAKPVNIGFLVESFGYSAFRRNNVGLNVAKGFKLGTSRKFNVGLGIKMFQVQADGYDSKTAIGISGGWSTALTEKTQIAFNAQNFSRPRFATDEEVERSLALGIQYKPTQLPTVFLVDVIKDVRFPLSLRTGVEIRPIDALALRAGATTAPSTYSIGAGFQAGKLNADFAAQRHESLGWSPNINLSIGF